MEAIKRILKALGVVLIYCSSVFLVFFLDLATHNFEGSREISAWYLHSVYTAILIGGLFAIFRIVRILVHGK